jgi:hypothetical protein
MFACSGYMSPEYAIDGLYSIKSDVFSFGVLVIEIVSGSRNRGFYHPDHNLNLLGHVSLSKSPNNFFIQHTESPFNNMIIAIRHGDYLQKAGLVN